MKPLSILFVLGLLYACSKTKSAQAEFYVRGNCGMCKDRIESAVKSLPGIQDADWNEKTSNLKVAYDSTQVKVLDIHKAIAATGHGTKSVEMDIQAHAALPECCQVGAQH